MPRVPTPQRQVQSDALGMSEMRPAYTAEMQTIQGRQQQALGQALDKAGDAAWEIATRQKVRENADAAFKVETQLRSDWIQAESDLRKSRRADQAKGVTGDVDKWWQDAEDKVFGAVTEEGQRRVLRPIVGKLRLHSLESFRRFEDEQGEVAHDANWKSSKELLISQASADPSMAPAAVIELQRKNTYYAAHKGLTDPAVTEAANLTDTTRLHSEIIKQLVTKDPTAAAKYFADNKGQIAGTSYDEITKLVDTASAANDGEKAAGVVWDAQGPKGYNDPVLLDKMEAEIRKQYPNDAARAKSGISALRERVAAHNSSQAEVKAGAINSVMDVYAKTRSLASVQQSPEWQVLGGADRMKIEEHITNVQTAQLNRASAADARNQTQLQRRGMGAYLQYSDPQVLAGMSDAQVQALLPSLGNELTSHLVDKKRALSSKLATTEAKLDQDDFNAIASDMGLKPFEKSPSEDHKATLGALKFRTEQMIDAAQQQKKAPLSRDEKNTLMRNEMAKTVSSPTWWGLSSTEKPVISLTPQELTQIKVPAPDRKQIVEAMAAAYKQSPRADLEPTDANVKRWYARSKSPAAALIPNAR
jgi:hypothetical protein